MSTITSYIGMVISVSVLSFYSDGYYFSFHVVDILQSFGLLWWILVVPPFSHFGYLVVNILSQVNFFSFVSTPFAHI